MENKICTKCKQLKPVTEFYKYKTSKDGLMCQCKNCKIEYSKQYQRANKNNKAFKNRLQKYNKKRYQENLDCMKEKSKKYYKANKNRIREYKKKWFQERDKEHYKINKDKIREYRKEYDKKYYRANKDRLREKSRTRYQQRDKEHHRSYAREYYHEKRRKDIKFRLNSNMSTAIYLSLKGNKGGKHWETLLGCTLNELQICMENQWVDGMNWDNYGSAWHIDHKIPISAFNFSSSEHLDFKRCWVLSNLQPMWASENRHKSNKLTESFQPSLQL